MSRSNYNRLLVVTAAMAAFQPAMSLAQSAPPEPTPAFDAVVVFGDSLSDPGNVFALTGQYAVRPFAPIPSAPYVIGGFHFTNGETWAERLSRGLRSPSGAGSAVRAPRFFTNYAFGGARARSGASVSPDLIAQVGMFFQDRGSVADAEALYVIWFGANDVRDALEALAVDQTGATSFAILQGAIGTIQSNVMTLWGAGARSFLVPNVPNIALTPAVASQPAAVQALAAQLSIAYNAALTQLLGGLAQLPGTRIVPLDVFALVNGILAAPSLYGITNTTGPCVSFGVVVQVFCADPRRYAFWDAIHPTATVHQILAERALAALTL